MSESSLTVVLEELLARFRAGDAGAKNALVERAYDRLLVVARGKLRHFPGIRKEEETAAILSRSIERISKALDDVRPTTARAFFGLAARHIRWVLLDLVGTTSLDPESLPSGSGGPPAPNPGGSGLREDILAAIEKLPVEQQEVVDLIFFNGLTQVEAADILGVHEATVKRRWAAARVKLAALLTDYGLSE